MKNSRHHVSGLFMRLSPWRTLPRRAYHKLKEFLWRKPALRTARFLNKASFEIILHTQGHYQPVNNDGRLKLGSDPRDCHQRWDLISKNLPPESRTALDLGCAEGFFTIQLARKGLIALGADNLRVALDLARHQCINNDLSNIGFIKQGITHSFIENLPAFDVVLFLSLMHHFIYKNGMEWSAQLLQRLRKKVNMTLFFDMGQSNEFYHRWHSLLPDMGSNPAEWIIDFLQTQGFTQCEVIGKVPADRHLNPPIERFLIKAK